MESILEFLYMVNLNKDIPNQLVEEAYKEILQISKKEQSNIFISSIFTYLMTHKQDSNMIIKLLEISFKQDNFNPFKEKIDIKTKYPIISLSGSGKKGIKTINISTSSAIVASSLGANILKPCSMSTSSMSGSGDFLKIVGVNTDLTIDQTKKLLKDTGIGIFAIEKLIPNFDKIYGEVFYTPNILSFSLAALLCPLKPDIVLYGLAHNNLELSGEILKKFGIDNYRIISSEADKIHYMDELNIFGNSYILDSRSNKKEKYNYKKILNLCNYNKEDIKQSNNKINNIKIALNVLRGQQHGAYEDIICLNSANLLQLSGIVETIEEGYYVSKKQIKTGKCINKLEEFIDASNGNKNKLKKLL